MNFENRTLFIADNLDIMRGMDSGTIDLIYLDPPFKSGKQWKAPIGSPAEGAAFKDIWTDEDIKDEWHGQIAAQHEELYQMIQASDFRISPYHHRLCRDNTCVNLVGGFLCYESKHQNPPTSFVLGCPLQQPLLGSSIQKTYLTRR